MLRKIFIGGNWKCNNSLKASVELVENVYNKISFDTSKVGKKKPRENSISRNKLIPLSCLLNTPC